LAYIVERLQGVNTIRMNGRQVLVAEVRITYYNVVDCDCICEPYKECERCKSVVTQVKKES